jgi:hypothetical protein
MSTKGKIRKGEEKTGENVNTRNRKDIRKTGVQNGKK